MRDEEILEPIGLEDVFVDGFTKHATRNGYMSCIGYRELESGTIAVIRLVWPVVNTEAAIEDAREALATPSPMQSSSQAKRGVH